MQPQTPCAAAMVRAGTVHGRGVWRCPHRSDRTFRRIFLSIPQLFLSLPTDTDLALALALALAVEDGRTGVGYLECCRLASLGKMLELGRITGGYQCSGALGVKVRDLT